MVTRAKKYLYLSRSETSRDKYVSTFLLEAKDSSYLVKYDGKIPYNADNIPSMKKESMPVSLNFSLLEDYFDCPYRFKLSMFYGFAQPLVPALGYGNVMHEIVKNIYKAAIVGNVIDKEDVKRMIDESFYLPYATEKLAENMYKSVTKAINHYVERNRQESINKEQLKIYAFGYEELTGTKADYMEVYHLDSENNVRESITDRMIEEVQTDIKDAAANIRRNHLPRKCDKENCSKCHFNYLCLSKAEKKTFEIG